MLDPLNAPDKPEHGVFKAGLRTACTPVVWQYSRGRLSDPDWWAWVSSGGRHAPVQPACMGRLAHIFSSMLGSCTSAPALHLRLDVGRTHLCAARQSWGSRAHMPTADLWLHHPQPFFTGHTLCHALTFWSRLVAIPDAVQSQDAAVHRIRPHPAPCCSFCGESLPLPCGGGGPSQPPSAVAGHRLRLGQRAAQGHPSGQQEVP